MQAAAPSGSLEGGKKVDEEKSKSCKKILFRLGLAELIMGVVVITLGLAMLFNVGAKYGRYSYYSGSSYYTSYYATTLGEGFWFGVWPVVSGSLAMVCGLKKELTMTIINVNYSFSILTAVVGGVVIIPSSIYASLYALLGYRLGLAVLVCVTLLGLAEMIIAIIAAVYTCHLVYAMGKVGCWGSCAGSCGIPLQTAPQQTMFVQTVVQAQPPGSPMQVNPGMVGYQQQTPNQQPMYYAPQNTSIKSQ